MTLSKDDVSENLCGMEKEMACLNAIGILEKHMNPENRLTTSVAWLLLCPAPHIHLSGHQEQIPTGDGLGRVSESPSASKGTDFHPPSAAGPTVSLSHQPDSSAGSHSVTSSCASAVRGKMIPGKLVRK